MPSTPLPQLLDNWDRQRPGIWAIRDRSGGGFSPEECAMLHGTPFVLPASLGPLNRADLNDARRPAGCVAYILWPFQLHSTCGGSGIDRHF